MEDRAEAESLTRFRMGSRIAEAYQKHHDHYVRLFREQRLPLPDLPQYNLAMQRERIKAVKPLDE